MWFKGCFHLHTSNSDGNLKPLEVYNRYKGKGYNFIAITDHDIFTRLDLDKEPEDNFLVIENSIEFGYKDTLLHILGIGLANNEFDKQQSSQKIIDYIINSGGIAIIAHPNWMWGTKFNELSSLKNYHGIEIFNSLIKIHEGSSFALEKWDYLLSSGHKVWGFAVEDLHYPKDFLIFKGWIMVNAKELTKECIFDSIKKGIFYSSTGIVLNKFGIGENRFYVSSKNGEEIIFIGDHGRILKVVDDKKGEIEVDKKLKYIRCEIRSVEGIAYTQPIFIDSL